MRLPAIAASLLLSTATLAACGGGVDKNAYVDQVTDVSQATASAATKLSTEMSDAKTSEALAGKLEELGTTIEKDSVKLDDIAAPKEVESKHQDYVDLMETFGSDLKGLAGRVREADTTQKATALLVDASKLTSDYAASEIKLVQDINTELRG